MNTAEQDRQLIEELAKLLWVMERRGYIQCEFEEDETDVSNLRMKARDAVQRARERMGVSLIKDKS